MCFIQWVTDRGWTGHWLIVEHAILLPSPQGSWGKTFPVLQIELPWLSIPHLTQYILISNLVLIDLWLDFRLYLFPHKVRSKNICWWSEYCLCCSTLKMCFIKTTVKLLVRSRSVTMQLCNNLKQVIISSECCIIQLLHETSQSWTYPNCHCTVFYWNV